MAGVMEENGLYLKGQVLECKATKKGTAFTMKILSGLQILTVMADSAIEVGSIYFGKLNSPKDSDFFFENQRYKSIKSNA